MTQNRNDYQKRWRERNKKHIRKERRAYYLKNRDRLLSKAKEHYQENREQKKAYSRQYYRENKKQQTANIERYRKQNPEWYKRLHARVQTNRRARLRKVKSERYDRQKVFDLFGGICIVCDEMIDDRLTFPNLKSFTIHHVIPVSRGGSDTLNNVAPAHFQCNMQVGNRVPIAAVPVVYNG